MKLKSIFLSSITLIALFFFLLLPKSAEARDPNSLTDWYIKDFKTEISLNADSSLDITEYITADCGNLLGKHGIFRVLPTRYKNTEGIFIDTPIKLISITDFEENPIPFEVTNDRFGHTLTWKIGDPATEVTGENNYKIIYKITKNAID